MSAYNDIRGTQWGLAIGLFKITPSLHRTLLGAVSQGGNNAPLLRILPLGNVHID